MQKIVSLKHFGKMLHSIEPSLVQSLINLRSRNVQSDELLIALDNKLHDSLTLLNKHYHKNYTTLYKSYCELQVKLSNGIIVKSSYRFEDSLGNRCKDKPRYITFRFAIKLHESVEGLTVGKHRVYTRRFKI